VEDLHDEMGIRNMRINQLLGTGSLLLLLLFWSGDARAQFLQWDYLSIATDTVQSGAYSDMKIGSDGTIHLSYWQRIENRLIYAYKALTDTTWHFEYVDPTQENGFRSSLSLDAFGNVHIAYYEDVNSEIGVRFAKRVAANDWDIEALPNIYNRGYGDYGPLGTITSKERLQHVLELTFDENNKPQIAFFDGWMAVDAFPSCQVSSLYSLKLHQGIRVNGEWFVRSFGRISDINESCNTYQLRDSLPTGDRYGEYLDLLIEPDGTMDIFSASRFNNEVIRHRTLFPFVDTVWVKTEVDSLERMLPGWTAGWGSFTRFYSFEGISARYGSDDFINMAYTSSIFYGDNFCCVSLTNDLVYTRISPTGGTPFHHNFGTSTYRNYTDIIERGGSDSLFLLYSDMTNLYFIMQESADSGNTWTADTILPGIAIGRNHLELYGDSLLALMFDASNERLLLGKRHVNGGNWRIEEVTYSQARGQSMDANYVMQANDTIAHTAFNDGYTGELYYATGSKSGNWAWSTEQIDPAAIDAVAVSIANTTAGEPVVVYNGGPNRDLRIAIHDAGGWQYASIVPAGNPQYTDIAISSLDTIHVMYYDGNQNCLHRASRHLSGSTWQVEDVACDTSSVGMYPNIVLDAAGLPHVSYYNDINRSLYYTRLDGGTRQWVTDSVNGGTSSAIGKFSSLVLDAAGNPKIAYLNEQSDAVLLSEWSQSGTWSHTMVDSQAISNIGRPIVLRLDDYGKVWVAYNYYTNFEKIKLMHRDGPIWREVAVSPAGRIANAFQFEILGDDLFVLGKKNEIQNTGVAMLYARNGVSVEAKEAELRSRNVKVKSFPNPSNGEMTFEVQVEQPATVSLTVYNLLGHRVAAIMEGQRLGAGTHQIVYDGSALAPGIYLYELQTAGGRTISKMVIAR
jgi:Secretion system C-terminal sorting domain